MFEKRITTDNSDKLSQETFWIFWIPSKTCPPQTYDISRLLAAFCTGGSSGGHRWSNPARGASDDWLTTHYYRREAGIGKIILPKVESGIGTPRKVFRCNSGSPVGILGAFQYFSMLGNKPVFRFRSVRYFGILYIYFSRYHLKRSLNQSFTTCFD
jgi:hypothetical protein